MGVDTVCAVDMNALKRVASETLDRASTTDLGSLNEANTKALFIEPMLTALGWNVLDLDTVTREYPVYDGTFLDYALLVSRRPALFCEAKPTRKSLDDPRWVSQAINYANNEGVVWCVLTDGLRWRIFKANEAAPMEKKMAFEVHIGDLFEPSSRVQAEKLFSCLTPAAVADGELTRLGTQVFVDSKIKASFIALLENPPNKLLELIRSHLGPEKSLKPADIRGAFARVTKPALEALLGGAITREQETLELQPQTNAASDTTDAATQRPVSPAERDVTIDDLTAAGIVPVGTTLHKTYLNTDLTAVVRNGGVIEFNGAQYTSLSAAGAAARIFVLGDRAKDISTATDGWAFWAVKTGESLTTLKDLRRRYAESSNAAS